jgi:hypothetical protein
MRLPRPGKAGRFRGALRPHPAYFSLHHLIAAFPCRDGRQAGEAIENCGSPKKCIKIPIMT